MSTNMFGYFLMWLIFIPIPIINGVIREKMYSPIVGELTANQISTVILSVLFFAYTYVVLKNKITDLSLGKVFLIGLFWVTLTIIFEFTFGHYIDKVSWQKLVDNYNIFKGSWWSLFLLFELISPLLVKLLKR